MAIFGILRSLDFHKLEKLVRIFINKPSLLVPTYRATKKTLKICDDLFGDLHHKDGKENAFRHALWNFLIAESCYPVLKNLDATIIWCDKITSFHEELAPNDDLAKLMDLHNNKIGRFLFLEYHNKSVEFITILTKEVALAIQVQNIAELKAAGEKLVYIED